MELHNQHILLVHLDEEKRFVNTFKRVFEEKGFTVMHVPTIDEAVVVLGQQTVDIIVLDITGEDQKAFQFCASIKKNKHFGNIKIIVLSDINARLGVSIDARTNEAKRWLNVDLYVHKPISSQSLYALMKKEIAIIEGITGTELDSEIDRGKAHHAMHGVLERKTNRE
ncbi:MAG: response regulator transcription factor [Candidatus Lokiarchaeota archaeon]|nr:response regulator transcription factor [Candidatus Lokiarchaeota archaeon]